MSGKRSDIQFFVFIFFLIAVSPLIAVAFVAGFVWKILSVMFSFGCELCALMSGELAELLGDLK